MEEREDEPLQLPLQATLTVLPQHPSSAHQQTGHAPVHHGHACACFSANSTADCHLLHAALSAFVWVFALMLMVLFTPSISSSVFWQSMS